MPFSIRSSISAQRQAVIFGPSFMGLGYIPVFTPFHQVAADNGNTPSFPMIEFIRTSLRIELFLDNLLTFIMTRNCADEESDKCSKKYSQYENIGFNILLGKYYFFKKFFNPDAIVLSE